MLEKPCLKLLKVSVSLKCYLNMLTEIYSIYPTNFMSVPHLDYGDIIYHNQRTDMMYLVVEQVQYKATLIVSGCWQGTNREKLYEELGWEPYMIEGGVAGYVYFIKY